jgi:hypothetical protein
MDAERLQYLLRRPWRDESVPAGVPGIPTMLSKGERRLLYALARDYASSHAAIVDGGCFLGGSTAALLAGLRDRSDQRAGPPLHSYDLFRVEAYTIEKFFHDDPKVRVGDSFRSRFDANVAGFDLPHVVHEGDITKSGWGGGPIDVLFLDVLKTWEVNDAVLRDFFPSLRPGRSVIVHQDYGSGWSPWIPITVELMRDSLRLVDGIEWGSHVFFVEQEIPAALMQRGVSSLDLETKFGLIDQAIARSEGWVRGMIELGRTPLVIERDGMEVGLRDLDRIADRYRGSDLVLSNVEYGRQGLATNWTFGTDSVPGVTPTRLDRARKRLLASILGR